MGLLLDGYRALHLHPPDSSVQDVSGREYLLKHPESNGGPHPSFAHPTKKYSEDFPCDPVVGTLQVPSVLGELGSCMHALQPGNEGMEPKQYCNKFNTEFFLKKENNLSACFNSSSFFLFFFFSF